MYGRVILRNFSSFNMKEVKVVFSFPGRRTFITFVYHTVQNGIYKNRKQKVVHFLKLNGGNFALQQR